MFYYIDHQDAIEMQGNAGYERAIIKFSAKRNADDVWQVYKSVLSQSKRKGN